MRPILVAATAALLAPNAARADDPGAAVKIVEKLGGTVTRDRKGVVTEVDLSLSGATDDDLKGLAPLTKLTALRLVDTRVTDGGLRHLAPFTELTGLHLNGTGVTNAGLKHIATRTKLTELGLGGTGVTDEGLKSLAPLTDLGVLHLVGTAVTDAGTARLRAALPRCVISR